MAIALGQTPRARADEIHSRCVDESDGTNTAWGRCGWDWVKREDDKLNAAWKRLYAGVAGQTKADLLDEQRAWVRYMKLSCGFYGNGDWGREGQVMDLPTCRAEVIAARTRQLEAFQEFMYPDHKK